MSEGALALLVPTRDGREPPGAGVVVHDAVRGALPCCRRTGLFSSCRERQTGATHVRPPAVTPYAAHYVSSCSRSA